ncbi:MAG: C45 family peptidase [Bacillota bacterium]|nr:C45 family peptidase [Bacillota bacterium]
MNDQGRTHYGSIPCLHLTGGARARGLAYGRGAAELIAKALDVYRGYFRRFAGVDWADAARAAAGVWRLLEQHTPDIAVEIAGIAEGSGQELLDIVALNARTEIAYGLIPAPQRQGAGGADGRDGGGGSGGGGGWGGAVSDECTSFAILSEHTGGRGVLAGQNWDWLAACMPIRVALHIELENGQELLTFCEAGQVGKIGVNRTGLVVCLNLLASGADGMEGIPVHVLCRKALEQAHLSDALRVVSQWPRAASSNLLLAQSYGENDGEALDVEFSPRGWAVLEANDGLLVHTNHFLADCGAPDQGLARPGAKSTFVRLARARRLLRLLSRTRAVGGTPGGGISPEDLMAVLGDHLDRPYSVCRHIPPPPDEAGQTDLAFIADPGRGLIWVSDGPPCGEGREGPTFVRYRLPWAGGGGA